MFCVTMNTHSNSQQPTHMTTPVANSIQQETTQNAPNAPKKILNPHEHVSEPIHAANQYEGYSVKEVSPIMRALSFEESKQVKVQEKEEENLCCACGEDMGPNNPRQLCGKWRCLNIAFDNDNIQTPSKKLKANSLIE